MSRMIRAASVFAATAAVVTLGAGAASAVSTDQYDRVRYMMCATGVVDISYTNAYGNTSTQNGIYFKKQPNGAPCGFYDFTEYEEYGGYASVNITDENGGPVSCTIWINGRVVSKSNDESSYYSYASCY